MKIKGLIGFSAIFLALTCSVLPARAQRAVSREEYIITYAPLAIEQQKLYGIPASIKMAQGILESGYGNSELSRMSNNHFGIKCKSWWTGESVTFDDDEKGECFRKYKTVEESYRDHSEFLKAGKHYAFLFDLKPDDYEGWAHGLKKAGYATAPHYAQSLIKCIEDYELYLLDEGEYPAYLAGVKPVEFLNVTAIEYASEGINLDQYTVSVFTAGGHGVFIKDGTRYILAREGESFRSLAKSLGISEKRLRKYNGAAKSGEPSAGEPVFIEKVLKRRRV